MPLQLRQVIDHMLGYVAVLEPDGTLIEVNASALAVGGLTRQQVIGSKFWQAPWWSFDPVVAGRVESAVRRAAAGEVVRYDEWVRTADDGRLLVDFMLTAAKDDRGHVTHLIPSGVDVTQRQEAQQRVVESERRLRLAAEATGFGSYELDVATGLSHWSGALKQIMGLSDAMPMPAAKLVEMVLPEDRASFESLVTQSLDPRGNGRHEADFRVRLPDGRVLWLRDVGQTHFESADDGSRRPVRVFGTVQDVSAQRRAQDQLRAARDELEQRVDERTAQLQQQTRRLQHLASELTSAEGRERKRLAALLHDDLQQYLVACGMRLQMASDRLEPSEAAEAVDEARQMLQQALEASRNLTRELRPPVLYESGLVAALRWLAEEMQRRHGLRVQLEASQDPPLGDDAKVMAYEFVRELLFNVVKHAKVDRARVRVHKQGGGVKLEVIDQGAGIAGELQDQTQTTDGIGLFSMRERLAAVGGTLELDTPAAGGTRAVIVLPTPSSKEVTADVEQAEPLGSLKSCGGGELPDRPRVVVVDDHGLVREGIATLLGGDPRVAVVGEGADGEQAVDLVEAHRPDVLLMDLNMPRLNGLDATRRLCRQFPGLRVVLLSVQDDVATRRTMLEAGASAFVSKSADADALLDVVLGTSDG